MTLAEVIKRLAARTQIRLYPNPIQNLVAASLIRTICPISGHTWKKR